MPNQEQEQLVKCHRQTAKKNDCGVIVCLFASPIVPYKILTVYRKNLRSYQPEWAIEDSEGKKKPIIVYKENSVIDKKEKEKAKKIMAALVSDYTYHEVFLWSFTHVGVKPTGNVGESAQIRPHWEWAKAMASNSLDKYKK